MKTTINMTIGALAGVVILSILAVSPTTVEAQAGRSATGGVYTQEQAERGQMTYSENCSFCHGDDLTGSDVIPGLVGDAFVKAWTDQTLGALYDKINATMPATAPGSLTPQQTVDTLAYMLSMSKYPTGTTELGAEPDELKQISLDPPQ